MNIKELIRFEDLKRKMIVEAIRILNKKGDMEENIRRKYAYIHSITEMFPDSTYMKEENREHLLNILCNLFDIRNNFDCGEIEPQEVAAYLRQEVKNEMLSIAMDYKENYLDWE